MSATGRRGSGRTSTREALMDAAACLFAERGYGATTVPDIVRSAGVGHGTFYEYFASRRDVLVAITERAGAARAARPDGDDRPIEDQTRDEVAWYLRQFVDELTLSRIWHAASHLDPDVAEMVATARRQRTAEVRASFERIGLGAGVDPAVAAVALTAMLEEFAHRWFVEGEGPGTSDHDVDSATETMTILTLRALGLEGDT